MKNKIILGLVVVMLAMPLDMGGILCQYYPPHPIPIIVGLARDLDGDLSSFECNAAGPVYRWFVNKVNAEGGIHLSEYDTSREECWVPIELVVEDFNVAYWDIAPVTQGLIDDGADFIWGGPGTDCIYSQAPVCNLNGVILTSFEGGTSRMVWKHESYLDNWPYVWINLSFANWYQIPVLKGIMDQAVTGRDPIAYVTYIGEYGAEHGLEYLQTTMDEFGSSNVLPAGSPRPGVEHGFAMNSTEANTIIQNAKTALGNATDPNYDIFCAFTYPWNVERLIQACIDNDFNPPAILFGPGANFGSFGAPPPDGFGAADVEGIMCFAVANNKTEVQVGTPTMSMAEMYAEIGAQIEDDWVNYATVCPNIFNATHGAELLDYWGTPCYVAALEMWKYAVEAAGNLYPQSAIRDVLASYSSLNPAQTVFGDTWYTVFGGGTGGGVMAYECHTGEIGQWRSGVIEIIGYDGINATLPNYCVTANFTYPMTDLWGWLS